MPDLDFARLGPSRSKASLHDAHWRSSSLWGGEPGHGAFANIELGSGPSNDLDPQRTSIKGLLVFIRQYMGYLKG